MMRLKELVNKGDFIKVYKQSKVLYIGYTNFINKDVLENKVSTSLGHYDIYQQVYIVE